MQNSSTKRCVIGIANCAVVYKIAICIGIKWVSGKIKKDIKVNLHDGFKCKQEESDTWDYRFSIYDGRRSDIKFDYSMR